ncbi:LIM domain-binding protein 3, partial [Hyalella azteca]|uniref:LIM domain-binding protein 3 n=1 Tax=Hyalella azteca TaxID=294128 RepID=A0A8B7PGX8_HYAAZ
MSNTVTLERDGHDQPWGFRLQGGVDVGLPLSVLRVLVGTPAESVLKKGDVITKIGARGTHGLSHQQAVELFNSAGNQIEVTFKRSGGTAPSPAPSVLSALHASTAVRTAPPAPPSAENPSVQALPRTTFVLKSELPANFSAPTVATDDSDKFSVQNQPYRTTPLVQPTAKAITELGIGSYTHLRLQEEICSGAREPQLVPVTPAQANALKANEYIMKQKTQQGLVNA